MRISLNTVSLIGIETLTKINIRAWEMVEEAIWKCELCRDHPRVACYIRQQTEAPVVDVKLLVVGIAPSFEAGIELKTQARSATNYPDDNLRKLFILATLPGAWEDLLARGFFLIHGVKYAITLKDRYQNPTDDVLKLAHLLTSFRRSSFCNHRE